MYYLILLLLFYDFVVQWTSVNQTLTPDGRQIIYQFIVLLILVVAIIVADRE